MSGFFDWLDTLQETTVRDRIALKEKLHETRAAAIRAKREADAFCVLFEKKMELHYQLTRKATALEAELKEAR